VRPRAESAELAPECFGNSSTYQAGNPNPLTGFAAWQVRLSPPAKEEQVDKFAFDPSVLASFVLASCLVCIWMVFFFGRKLQTSAYLRTSLIEGAKQQELKILLRELQDRAIAGPLDAKNPPPDGYGPTKDLWQPDQGRKVASGKYASTNETEEQKRERLTREQEARDLEEKCRAWERDEKVRYDAEEKKAEAEALQRAQAKIPSSIDISLLGGGWAFLLEFSTVIVIIFTLLILGILKTLEGKDISTILAAIAGYVLGKATSGAKSPEKDGEARSASSGK
jgi:hypothetical protein